MNREKALDKVKKLLALSTFTNQGEAQNALAAAQRLMAQFGWTKQDLKISKDEVYEEIFETKTKGVSPNTLSLLNAISTHFRVVVVIQKGVSSNIRIYGETNDVTAFIAIGKFIVQAQEKEAKKYLQSINTNSRSESIMYKNDFCAGFRNGCIKALESNEKNYSLVVITPDAVVERVKQECTGTNKSHQKRKGDAESYIKGFFRGKQSMEQRQIIK